MRGPSSDVDAVAVERVDGGLHSSRTADVVGEDADRSRVQLVRQERELPERRGVITMEPYAAKRFGAGVQSFSVANPKVGVPLDARYGAPEKKASPRDHWKTWSCWTNVARQVGVLRRRPPSSRAWAMTACAVDAPWALTMSK